MLYLHYLLPTFPPSLLTSANVSSLSLFSNNEQWSLHPTSLAKATPQSALHYLCNNVPSLVPAFLSFPQWMETLRNSLQNLMLSGVTNLQVCSKVSWHLPLPSFWMFLWLFPGTNTFCAQTSFWPGQKFRNHQTCRAWMGAHLPYRNMYHKGIFPLWNKHTTMPLMKLLVCFDGRISHTVSFISILLERSPCVPLSFSTFHASHSLLLCSIARLTALALFYLFIYLFSSPAFC